jgi:ankyrin repeat protein
MADSDELAEEESGDEEEEEEESSDKEEEEEESSDEEEEESSDEEEEASTDEEEEESSAVSTDEEEEESSDEAQGSEDSAGSELSENGREELRRQRQQQREERERSRHRRAAARRLCREINRPPISKRRVSAILSGEGGGDVLWEECHRRTSELVFERFLSSVPRRKLEALLLPLLAEQPGLAQRQGPYGRTLLHLAASGRAPPNLVRVLLEQNRDALMIQDSGQLPIHCACDTSRNRRFDLETIRLLVEADPAKTTLGARDRQFRRLPLHFACIEVPYSSRYDLKAVKLVMSAHPAALRASDSDGYTPIMLLITGRRFDHLRRLPHALPFLQRMIKLGGAGSLECKHTYHNGSVVHRTALAVACEFSQNKDLFSSLIKGYPKALEVRNEEGDLPLHTALWIADWSHDGQVRDAIQVLIEACDDALLARNNRGETPVAIALERLDGTPPGARLLLEGMIRRAPGSVRGTFTCRTWHWQDNVVTCLELACARRETAELVPRILEAWPFALCVSLLGDLSGFLPDAVAAEVRREADAMLVALIEVLLHDTTLGVVPDPVRAHVRRAVCRLAPPGTGSSLAVVQSVQNPSLPRQELRANVLGSDELQAFLWSHGDVEELVTGVYRMNKEGRLGGSEEGEGCPIALSASQHVRILQATKDNLGCLFLHLRDCPVLFAGAEVATAYTRPTDADAAG